MATINFSDNLFVNIVLRGHRLMSLRLTGFGSIKELMAHLSTQLREYSGQLLTMELRNSTQGWHRTNAVLFAA